MGCKSWMLFSRISVSPQDSLRKRATHVRKFLIVPAPLSRTVNLHRSGSIATGQ